MGPILKIAHMTNSPVDFFLAVYIGFFFGFILEGSGLANCRKIAGIFYLYDVTVVQVMFTGILTCMLLLYASSALGILDLTLVFVPQTYLISYILAGFILGAGMVAGGY